MHSNFVYENLSLALTYHTVSIQFCIGGIVIAASHTNEFRNFLVELHGAFHKGNFQPALCLTAHQAACS